ncbi:hypothetical protein VT50_0210715 [Streptomyces antioxidans]|uniref:Luciferase-like domain-containing protein n=1 Tax=Streptomyces antioxidans TaxID=1507734 RepID=A0A1V4D7N9_9ACTN|nr:LLM class flavin-dependent oxidoreductase [Streptomyces antioxidans]OPF81004.1 hypothetical protein VT50_0210715 [Streptomyces antioxidans]
MSEPVKQVPLGAACPGVDNTVWSDPNSGSQIDFSSFRQLAQTAERGKFALARRFATLDHLSGGRAAWDVVTSSDTFTGANFRRGGFLDRADRYTRAAEFVAVARELWDAWAPDAVAADPAAGVFVKDGAIAEVRHRGPQFDISARPTVPRGPRAHPVLIQAGNSGDGRESAAATADAIYTIHAELAAGQAFYADVKGPLAAYGRAPGDLKILPQATFVLGDTAAEARERARHIRLQQVSPQGAIAQLEQVWGCDLSGYDPDGPLPDVEPLTDGVSVPRVHTAHAHEHERVAVLTEEGFRSRNSAPRPERLALLRDAPGRAAAGDLLVAVDEPSGTLIGTASLLRPGTAYTRLALGSALSVSTSARSAEKRHRPMRTAVFSRDLGRGPA